MLYQFLRLFYVGTFKYPDFIFREQKVLSTFIGRKRTAAPGFFLWERSAAATTTSGTTSPPQGQEPHPWLSITLDSRTQTRRTRSTWRSAATTSQSPYAGKHPRYLNCSTLSFHCQESLARIVAKTHTKRSTITIAPLFDIENILGLYFHNISSNQRRSLLMKQ